MQRLVVIATLVMVAGAGCRTVKVVSLVSRSVEVSNSAGDPISYKLPRDTLSTYVFLHDTLDQSTSVLLAADSFWGPEGKIWDAYKPDVRKVPAFWRPGMWTAFYYQPQRATRGGWYKLTTMRNPTDTNGMRVGKTTAEIHVLCKVGEKLPDTGKLDVTFTFVGRPYGLTASKAKADSAFQQALTRMRGLFASLGVAAINIEYRDMGGRMGQRFRRINSASGPNNELAQMFNQHKHSGKRTLNYYFVEEISAGGRFIILGTAGGIPGPPGIDSPYSGVAVSMIGYQYDPERMGTTMAHEGGHYLGLYHTSERTGTLHDPLADTPQCTQRQDRDRNGLVDNIECAQHGALNMMFWLSSKRRVQTSPEQGRIVRSNPLVTH